MELVTTRHELLANMTRIDEYFESKTDSEYSYALKLPKRMLYIRNIIR